MLGKFALAAAIAVPTALGGLAGFMIARQTLNSERANEQRDRVEEVRAQSRMVADSLLEEIETLRGRAIGYEQIHTSLDPSILHWAEVSSAPLTIRQSVINPGWQNPASQSILDNYLAAALRQLNLNDLRTHGVSILRVKKDPQSQAEWIAFAFPVPSDPHGILLALTEPSRIFTSFGRWASRSEGGRLRGYLIGSDGYVLAHSNPAYIGANFSDTQAFRGAMRAMLNGQRLNGIGDWSTVDQLPAMVSYLRLGSLPLGVVVERVITPDSGGAFEKTAIEVASALGMLTLLIGLEIWALRRVNRRGPEARVLEPEARVLEPEARVLEPEAQIQNELPAVEVIAEPPIVSNARAEERFLLTQFESDSSQIKDSRRLALKLTLATSRIFMSPALFFGYHESVHAAVLEAHAGFDEFNKPSGMSCPVPDSVLRKIFEREERSSPVSLADYGPLATLLNARDFEAWAVTGFAPEGSRNGGGPRLLGILAILNRPDNSRIPTVARLMKATGLSYENTLLS